VRLNDSLRLVVLILAESHSFDSSMGMQLIKNERCLQLSCLGGDGFGIGVEIKVGVRQRSGGVLNYGVVWG